MCRAHAYRHMASYSGSCSHGLCGAGIGRAGDVGGSVSDGRNVLVGTLTRG